MVARAGSFEPRAEESTTRAGKQPLIITTIRLSKEVVPSDGTHHLANQPNPITVIAAYQPKALDVFLSIAASPRRSATVPLPSSSMDGEEEVDGADIVCARI